MEITDRATARMADSPLPLFLRGALVSVGALLVAPGASALSLGEADLRSFRGQPLDIRIPMDRARSEYVGLDCFKVAAGDEGGSLATLEPARFRLEESLDTATLVVRTDTAFDLPLLGLQVSFRCPGTTAEASRRYRLTLPPLQPAAVADALPVPAQVIIQRPGEAPVVQNLGPASAAPVPPSRGARTWRVTAGDSLESIARGVYPKSAKMRAAFIARLREANPALATGDRDPLAEGLRLNWPDLIALANASPRLDPSVALPPAETPAKPSPSSQDRRPARGSSQDQRVPEAGVPASAPPATPAASPRSSGKPVPPESTARAPGTPPSAGFALRLSGATLDVSRSQGVSENTRAALRAKQLLLDADDQVAALLSLRNTVKQLEGRLNELQLKLATLPPGGTRTAETAAPAPASPPEKVVATSGARPDGPTAPPAAQPAPEKVQANPPVTNAPPAAAATPPRPAAASAPAPVESDESAWWQSPFLALGGGVLLALVGLAIWARRRPATGTGVDHFSPNGPNPLAGDLLPRASQPGQPDEDADSVADQFQDDLEQRFAATAATHSAPRNSGFRAHETQRLVQAGRAAPEDDLFAASLELDTRPATAIDLVLGDEAGEDKSRRQRYMEERFPELASRSISVDDPDSIIDVARHHYEESELQRAVELLTYAFEERPGQLRFWLALFEIYRLEQKAGEFLELATRFKNVHGGTDAWPKVQHIGRDLDPAQALYAPALGRLGVPVESDFDPVSENWLNVPMDFTSEVLMIELRQCLLSDHDVDAERLSRPLLEPA